MKKVDARQSAGCDAAVWIVTKQRNQILSRGVLSARQQEKAIKVPGKKREREKYKNREKGQVERLRGKEDRVSRKGSRGHQILGTRLSHCCVVPSADSGPTRGWGWGLK